MMAPTRPKMAPRWTRERPRWTQDVTQVLYFCLTRPYSLRDPPHSKGIGKGEGQEINSNSNSNSNTTQQQQQQQQARKPTPATKPKTKYADRKLTTCQKAQGQQGSPGPAKQPAHANRTKQLAHAHRSKQPAHAHSWQALLSCALQRSLYEAAQAAWGRPPLSGGELLAECLPCQ